MKDVLFLLVIVLAIAVVLYFSYIFLIQKSVGSDPELPDFEFPALTTAPPAPPKDDLTAVSKKQSETAEEVWRRQKRMMEDQKQKIRDIQRR